MKYRTIFILFTGIGFMTACGGGSSSSSTPTTTPPTTSPPTVSPTQKPPSCSNAELSDGEQTYGYYGENVLFGTTLVSDTWVIELDSTHADLQYGLEIFYKNGTVNTANSICQAPDLATSTYGVSDNCKVLTYNQGRCYYDSKFNSPGRWIPVPFEVEITKQLGNGCYEIVEENLQTNVSSSGIMCTY